MRILLPVTNNRSTSKKALSLRRLTLVSAALLAFGNAKSASAATARPQVFHARQLLAQATFHPVDPTGCSLTTVLIQAGTTVVHRSPGGPTRSPLVTAVIAQYNQCAGTAVNALGSALPSNLDISPSLKQAHVSATLNMFDTFTGRAYPFTVDVTWTASGPVTRQVQNSVTRDQGITVIRHYSGATAPAQATGVLTGTVGTGTFNFTALQSDSAEIDRAQEGDITLQA